MDAAIQARTRRRSRWGGDEGGYALVIALITMTLLTIIGVASMATTNIDLNIAGNIRRMEQARFASIAGAEHARHLMAYGEMPSISDVAYFGETSGTLPYFIDWDQNNTLPTAVEGGSSYLVQLTFLKCGGAPAGYSLEKYHSQFFDLVSEGFLVENDTITSARNRTKVTTALTVRKVIDGTCYMR